MAMAVGVGREPVAELHNKDPLRSPQGRRPHAASRPNQGTDAARPHRTRRHRLRSGHRRVFQRSAFQPGQHQRGCGRDAGVPPNPW